MEPAPFSAGNYDDDDDAAEITSASMEPAPFSAGNMPNLWAPSTRPAGFNGAGAFQRRKQEDHPDLRRRVDRFNGAGAFQRRKLADYVVAFGSGGQLQWSRRLSAPETNPT